jgi:hypothetical protein
MKFAFLLSFITGVKVGGEFYEVEGLKHLDLDLFIVNLVICWGDIDQLEIELEE